MEQSELQRPKNVEIAVLFLSATLTIGIFQMYFGPGLAVTGGTLVFVLCILLATYAFFGLLLFKIWHGKNWARITYAIFLGIGLLQTGAKWFFIPDAPHPSGALPLTMIAVKVIAIGLLFIGASNSWFRRTAL